MAKKENKGKVLFGSVIAVLTVLVLACGGGFLYYLSKNTLTIDKIKESTVIFDGVSIDGIDVSGKTKDEAKALLMQSEKYSIENKTITLEYDGKERLFLYSDFDGLYDVDLSVDAAYNIGRDKTDAENLETVKSLSENPAELVVEYRYDEEKIKNIVTEFASEINVEGVDSTLTRKNGQFVVTDEKTGIALNEAETLNKIKQLVDNKEQGTVAAVVDITQPKITRADNEKCTSLIGSFYTNYSGSDTLGRNINLVNGSSKVNGMVLAPDAVFSMNEALGPQTYENGYRSGGVIVNGKIEDGIGGGVCQITTTVYNAAIFAELDIVERKNHSVAVGYVPLGRDSAVAGTWKDLKFKNNTGYPIYIECYARNGKLECNIYGYEVHSPTRKIEFEKVFVSTIEKPAEKITLDPNIPDGERKVTYEGKTGSKVSTYKKVYENGVLLSREWFSDSVYSAVADEVTVGTGKSVKQETVPAETETNKKQETVPTETETNKKQETVPAETTTNNTESTDNNTNIENNNDNVQEELPQEENNSRPPIGSE